MPLGFNAWRFTGSSRHPRHVTSAGVPDIHFQVLDPKVVSTSADEAVNLLDGDGRAQRKPARN